MTRTFDPFDELAAMFLTAPPHVPQPPPIERRAMVPQARPSIARQNSMTELLIVGHLPVRAGLWLTPYADMLARDVGTTALLRLDGEQPSLQVLRGQSEMTSRSSSQTLQQTIAQVGPHIGTWIVRAGAESKAIDLVRVKADRITILSSADETAVVAAYQVMKDLAQAAEEAQIQLPTIGLAVLGADAGNAAAVVERLNRTTVSFLGVAIKLVLCLPRMDTGVKSTQCEMFAEPNAPALPEVMEWIVQARLAAQSAPESSAVVGSLYKDRVEMDALSAEQVLRSPPASPPAVMPGRYETPAAVSPLRIAPEPAAPPRTPVPPLTPMRTVPSTGAGHYGLEHPTEVAPSFAAAPEQASVSQPSPQQSSPPPPFKLAPKPSINVEPKDPLRPVEPDDHGRPIPLANHVKTLTPLPIRSPGHERIELAVDVSGRLHLLGRDPSLREMRIVESWARAHREIIAMACPQQPINQSAPCICHIFSSEPSTLADLHGTDLRLHVLSPVVVNGQTGWYAAPLNK